MEVEEQQDRSEDEMSVADTESEAESSEGGEPGTDDTEDMIKFKLASPMGGSPIEFAMSKKRTNSVVQQELQLHLSNIFLNPCFKVAFERGQGVTNWKDLPWSDAVKCRAMVAQLNKCISGVVSLLRDAAGLGIDLGWFTNSRCTADQSKKLSFTIFNRVVKHPEILNKCYPSFSSLTYGETSFDQIQIIMDKLQMTGKDVFVDLGSGVGHVVTYAAAYTSATKCVGIEINDLPAQMGTKMQAEFEGMMKWYGKKHGHVEIVHGDFLDDKFKKLLTKEATVIYMNNLVFDAKLMHRIRQLVYDMPDGTRIICTKSLSEEREDRGRGDGEKFTEKRRRISARSIQRQAVDMMLDVEKLPVATAPVSWCAGNGMQFLMFTVNLSKTAHIYEESEARKRNRSGSDESQESMASSRGKKKKKLSGSDEPRKKEERLGSKDDKKKKGGRSKPKPVDKFPFGKVAAIGHSYDYDKKSAPEWAGKKDRHSVAVYAPHHSIFEDNEPLPEKRARKTMHGSLKM